MFESIFAQLAAAPIESLVFCGILVIALLVAFVPPKSFLMVITQVVGLILLLAFMVGCLYILVWLVKYFWSIA